jgi:CheY-like chemotaxis protein
MKLNYNIIWVDDKIDTRPYISMKKEVFDFITNEFFNCTIEEAEDFNEFIQLFTDNITYDLIITDLSLNSGTTGKQVIDYIRDNKHNHAEIFFYSANTQLRQQELINSNRITFYQLTEGNYNELKNEIIDLVKLTISKFQHIVSMRGMIMQETSSLDTKMLDIINSTIENEKIDLSETAISIFDQLNSLFDRKNEIVNECKEKNNFKKLTKDNFIFSADYKIQTIKKITEFFDGISDFTDEYKEEINSIRNKFAHAVLETDDNGRQFFSYKQEGITFDENLCKEIRRNIIKHNENLENLQSKIN